MFYIRLTVFGMREESGYVYVSADHLDFHGNVSSYDVEYFDKATLFQRNKQAIRIFNMVVEDYAYDKDTKVDIVEHSIVKTLEDLETL